LAIFDLETKGKPMGSGREFANTLLDNMDLVKFPALPLVSSPAREADFFQQPLGMTSTDRLLTLTLKPPTH